MKTREGQIAELQEAIYYAHEGAKLAWKDQNWEEATRLKQKAATLTKELDALRARK
jgi:hypothetical protein